jgi:glyoxylase-like metal-dependent hydrolase (beta-lactamase superfamily II)
MDIYRAEHPMYLSNAYLVVNDGKGIFVDGHGEEQELVDRVESEGIEIEAILLTHHHGDHVQLENYEKFDVPIYASDETNELLGGDVASNSLNDGEEVTIAGLTIKPIATPGHARGHTALLIDGTDVITADVLFKGTVGGSRAPDNTGFDDLKASVEKLMSLPPETVVHPGHKEKTTIAEESENNVFVRAFRGDEDSLDEPVKVGGQEATLLVWGPDYDGTNKAWVRFPDGSQDVTGGSQVERG